MCVLGLFVHVATPLNLRYIPKFGCVKVRDGMIIKIVYASR